jgi:amino-acid N-acetyltransferase
LLQEILEYASRLSLRNVFLLTTTAEHFFKKHGFVIANRTEAPSAIRTTSEFSSLCPSTAVFMSKQL